MQVSLPKIIFGSSALGNLYQALDNGAKNDIVAAWMDSVSPPVVIDSAGKYGAGLALEEIGQQLKALEVDPSRVLISNKLGWKRVPLKGAEPTFESGVWKDLKHDAVQNISAKGILDCFEQGNELLGDYHAQLVSVHDPDEYLDAAFDPEESVKRYREIKEAYAALRKLKEEGRVLGVGVGAKDWRVIKRLHEDGIVFDWVMFANSCTVYSHPEDVLALMQSLHEAGSLLINSAVFHAGFLTGGKYFDYREVTPERDAELFAWRDKFNALCDKFSLTPALACCQFALSPPGVAALAMNTSRASRVADNVALVETLVPAEFWVAMKNEGLLRADYPHL